MTDDIADYAAFLRWAYPDPWGNLVRGHLAEYLVGRALGCLTGARREWDSCDLHLGSCRIEVKATGARQAWPAAARPSAPAFGIGPQHASDLHVMAWHNSLTTSPTDPDTWSFFVVPTQALPQQRSIRLSRVRHLAGETSYADLPAAVDRVLSQEARCCDAMAVAAPVR